MAHIQRRDFLKAALAAAPLSAFDWDAFPQGDAERKTDGWDVIVIGSGLGGLACATAFARKGYRPLVLEQHDKPGGYATAFRRPGGFLFDVSLHSTGAGERNGVRNLIGGFPEISSVEFEPHPNLYRAIYPDHDIRVPQRDIPGYVRMLSDLFPGEEAGIQGLIDDMRAFSGDINRYLRSGRVDNARVPTEFPHLARNSGKTWGQMVDARIQDPKLKTLLSAQWVYYGLPPSRLASFYYALPYYGYLSQGGYYPKGRSQTISDAFVSFIEGKGGKVLLNTRVDKILVESGAAVGVMANQTEYRARAVVSNASAPHTFDTLVGDGSLLGDYGKRLSTLSQSLSSFIVFLGLKKDLTAQSKIPDTEIFLEPSYDLDASYKASKQADAENCGLCLTLYDNVFPGYSPKGKNTLAIIVLQGFEHWEKYEADYRKGQKAAYRAEKERMAKILIQRVENKLLPGLSKAIAVKDVGTPLTNLRYTGCYRGAIYGWDQTLNNSGGTRIGHATPIKNLYLAGAWSTPGHGYGAVIYSGLSCFGEIARSWA
jgi:all-trans-retinol 13,14-reductase